MYNMFDNHFYDYLFYRTRLRDKIILFGRIDAFLHLVSDTTIIIKKTKDVCVISNVHKRKSLNIRRNCILLLNCNQQIFRPSKQ